MVSIWSVFWEKVVSIVVSILTFFLQTTVVITALAYLEIKMSTLKVVIYLPSLEQVKIWQESVAYNISKWPHLYTIIVFASKKEETIAFVGEVSVK